MNTTNQQTNTDQNESHSDPKGAQLCQTLVHITLEKMIDQVKNQELSFSELCNALHRCCQHKKADAAQEKIRSTERIAHLRLNQTPNTRSNLANHAHNRSPLRDPASPEAQPEALSEPNHADSPEQSHEQFCQTLTEAAKDIWGIDISHFHKPKNRTADPDNHHQPKAQAGNEHHQSNDNQIPPPKNQPTPTPGLPFGGPPTKPDTPDNSQPSPPNQHHPNPLASSRLQSQNKTRDAAKNTNQPDDNPSQPPKTDPAHNRLPLRDPERLYDIPPQYRQGATPIKDSQQKYGQPKYTHEQWRKAMHQAIRANYGIYDDLPQNNNPKTDPTEPNHPQKPNQPDNNPTHPP